jgi:hypothetical protein
MFQTTHISDTKQNTLNKISERNIMRGLLSILVCASILLSCSFASATASGDAKQSLKKIPMSMAPRTIITYDAALNPIVSVEPAVSYVLANDSGELVDKKGRAAEDAYCAAIRESVKDLPVVNLGYQLPVPVPGMVVMYGFDGLINHIYPENVGATSANFNESTTLAYPSRLPAGTYTYGTNQKTTITSSTAH